MGRRTLEGVRKIDLVLPSWYQVEHKGEWKFCGLGFFSEEYRVPVLLHEESGTQGHDLSSSPCPMDEVLLRYLDQNRKPFWVFHYNRKSRINHIVPLRTILDEGSVMQSDGRTRRNLKIGFWMTVPTGYKVVQHPTKVSRIEHVSWDLINPSVHAVNVAEVS